MGDLPMAGRRLLFLYYVSAALAWRLASVPFGDKRASELVPALVSSAVKGAIWILPAMWIARNVLHQPLGQSLGLQRAESPAHPGRALVVSVVFLGLVAGLQLLASGGRVSAGAPLPLGIAIDAANATVEEIPFRGFMLGWLARKGSFWRANVVAAALFVMVHWLGAPHGIGWAIVPMSVALLALALVLGWVTRLSGSVWMAIALHAMNNAIASRLGGG
jgi:membrane protease YdiL (CAAX protease family)